MRRGGWLLGLGALTLAILWLGPLPRMAHTSFSAHMILHLGLMVVAAPLLALGLTRAWPEAGEISGGWAVAASVVDLVVVWSWHAPALHAMAALRPPAFAVQQASFLTVGLLVWFTSFAGAGRGAAGAGALALAMSFMHMTMLGVLLATSPLLYPPGLCGGGFGLGPEDDQRLGGLLMATAGGLPFLIGAAVRAARLLSDGEAGSPPGSVR